MSDQNEKEGVEEMAATIDRTMRGALPIVLLDRVRLRAARDYILVASKEIADRDAQIAEAELAAAGALAQIVEMRAEINQIAEERTTEVDGLLERVADAEKQAKDAEAASASSIGLLICASRTSPLTRQLATMRCALLAADVAFKSIKARTDTGQIARAIAAKGITDIFLCLAATNELTAKETSLASGYAEQGWNARQPEIDALRERNRKLREYAACDYYCASDQCSICDRPVEWTDGHGCEYYHTRDHPFTPKPCSCGLATLLATEEVE